MKIGIVPSIQERYKDQFEYTCDINLFKFLKSIFAKSEIELLTLDQKIDKKFKLIIISGANGNELVNFSKKRKNIIKKKIDNKFYKLSQNLNIPILGICHGAQFLAKKFSSNLKKKNHIGNHIIKFLDKEDKTIVNSYHTKVITKLGKKLCPKALAYDNTIEYFTHKTRKIAGIMWHPERYKKFKKIDKIILKSLCN